MRVRVQGRDITVLSGDRVPKAIAASQAGDVGAGLSRNADAWRPVCGRRRIARRGAGADFSLRSK